MSPRNLWFSSLMTAWWACCPAMGAAGDEVVAEAPACESAEAPLLSEHIQLTSRDRFIKAGEAYFDHHSPPRWVIFQAVPVLTNGKEPQAFYAMYIAKLKYEGERIVGLEEPVEISPAGSANTCGWFHPTDPARVLYGSTLTAPSGPEKSGFQVGSRKYIWQFPAQMEIVEQHFHGAAPGAANGASVGSPRAVFERPQYDAECSWSADGRYVLHAQVREASEAPKPDADIFVYDTREKRHIPLVQTDGYDGGPFFSPDGRRICYRSDRVGNDLLQLFIAELKLDADGGIIGLASEKQLTDNTHVNWAPFWHPSGRFLVYATSRMGHQNYEVFAIEADMEKPIAEVRHRRVTNASGADVLPSFSNDGRWMMWTAQRGAMVDGESKPSSQVWIARFESPDAAERERFWTESGEGPGK